MKPEPVQQGYQPLVHRNDDEPEGEILYSIGLYNAPDDNKGSAEADTGKGLGLKLENAWAPPAAPPTPLDEEQLDFWSLLDRDLLTGPCQSDPKDASCTRQPYSSTDSGDWCGNFTPWFEPTLTLLPPDRISDNEQPLTFAERISPPSPSSDAPSICFGQRSASSHALLENETFSERYFPPRVEEPGGWPI